jgi:hypothetical protein
MILQRHSPTLAKTDKARPFEPTSVRMARVSDLPAVLWRPDCAAYFSLGSEGQSPLQGLVSSVKSPLWQMMRDPHSIGGQVRFLKVQDALRCGRATGLLSARLRVL